MAFLDETDGDTDLEPEPEPIEANLAGFENCYDQADDAEQDDCELEDGNDDEPSLGSLGSGSGDQTGWGALSDGALDAEAEHDGREPSLCGITAGGRISGDRDLE